MITGITGQDGSYLAELLLDKGYVVHGIKRRSSSYNQERLDHLVDPSYANKERFFLHYGDLTDMHVLVGIMREVRPHEVYNLGAQSHVQVRMAYHCEPQGEHSPPRAPRCYRARTWT